MKIALIGYFGYDNIGDDAILQSVISQLKRYHRPLQLYVFAHRPDRVEKRFRVQALNRMSFPAVLAGMSMSDLVIFAGGSLFQDRTSFRSLLYYCGILILARIYGKKVILYSQGIEPFRYKWSEWLIKNTFLFAHHISVRDRESLTLLNKLLHRKKRIQYVVDSALLLAPYRVNNLYQGFIGLNLMFSPHFPRDSVVEQLDRFSKTYQRRYLYIAFNKEDLKVGQEIKMRLSETQIVILDPEENISQLLGIIQQLDLMVGMRLHSLILSAAARVPLLGIHLHDKVNSFCKEVNQPVIRFSDLQKGALYSNLEAVFKERKRYQSQLSALVDDLVKESKDNLINNIIIKYDKTG
jgi:polysaccharide pyruvyl transferase CsaB